MIVDLTVIIPIVSMAATITTILLAMRKQMVEGEARTVRMEEAVRTMVANHAQLKSDHDKDIAELRGYSDKIHIDAREARDRATTALEQGKSAHKRLDEHVARHP